MKCWFRVDLMDTDGSNLVTVYPSDTKDKKDKIYVSMTGTGDKVRYKIYIENRSYVRLFEVSF